MLNIDQEKNGFWGKYRYSISNIGMENIDMKYRYIKRKISIFSLFPYRYCITSTDANNIWRLRNCHFLIVHVCKTSLSHVTICVHKDEKNLKLSLKSFHVGTLKS